MGSCKWFIVQLNNGSKRNLTWQRLVLEAAAGFIWLRDSRVFVLENESTLLDKKKEVGHFREEMAG